MLPNERKPSIKNDLRNFFIISNIGYIFAVSLIFIFWPNRLVAFTAFAVILLNSLVCFLFFLFRIRRYQRCELTPKQKTSSPEAPI